MAMEPYVVSWYQSLQWTWQSGRYWCYNRDRRQWLERNINGQRFGRKSSHHATYLTCQMWGSCSLPTFFCVTCPSLRCKSFNMGTMYRFCFSFWLDQMLWCTIPGKWGLSGNSKCLPLVIVRKHLALGLQSSNIWSILTWTKWSNQTTALALLALQGGPPRARWLAGELLLQLQLQVGRLWQIVVCVCLCANMPSAMSLVQFQIFGIKLSWMLWIHIMIFFTSLR